MKSDQARVHSVFHLFLRYSRHSLVMATLLGGGFAHAQASVQNSPIQDAPSLGNLPVGEVQQKQVAVSSKKFSLEEFLERLEQLQAQDAGDGNDEEEDDEFADGEDDAFEDEDEGNDESELALTDEDEDGADGNDVEGELAEADDSEGLDEGAEDSGDADDIEVADVDAEGAEVSEDGENADEGGNAGNPSNEVAAAPPATAPTSGPDANCTPANNPMELVGLNLVTHQAVASGPWSAASTWSGGQLPTSDARVHIPAGIAVELDQVSTARLKSVRIDGTLSVATDRNTGLQVDTMVSTPAGTLEVGNASRPVGAGVSSNFVFVDNGAVNRFCDPRQLGRGAVLMGRTEMHGAAKTHRAVLAAPALTGESIISLTEMPFGWQVGDELVITGTVVNDPRSDEIRTISAINGALISLSQPLQLDHQAPAAGLNVYVANISRNIEFTSENATLLHRGHIMFMHTLNVDVQNARFTRLGRTDKTRPLDDLVFEFPDVVGNATSAGVVFNTTQGSSSNIRGRYPVHFHRGGTDMNSTPGLVKGSVVFDGPGWGFVMHSAHVNFVDNVSYGLQGAGFYTEAGDEVGNIEGNIAIRSVNSAFMLDSEGGAIDPDLGAENQEFGNDGDGYWLSGHSVSLINNVSAGSTAHGFIYWTDGLVEADIPTPARASVKVADIENGDLIPGRETIPTWWAPLAEIRGNEAYGSTIGFRMRYTHAQSYLGEGGSEFHKRPPQAYIDTLRPTVDGLTVWNSRDGAMMNYTARMSLKNSRLVGIGAPFFLDGGTANSGQGLDLGTEVTNGFARIDSVRIEGYDMGFVMPRNDQWIISNLYMANVRDMLIAEPRQGPRTLNMTNVTFGDLAGTAVAGRESERQNIQLNPVIDEAAYQPYYFVLPDHISLNGEGIYFDQQAAEFIPLPQLQSDEESVATIPADYVGATNAQLQSRFGLSFGGRVIPAGARRDSRVQGGFVGALPPAATRFPPLFDMTNEGGNPEPIPGTTIPEIIGNSLEIAKGQRLTLMRADINTTDTDTGFGELRYTASNVRNGFFAHRDAPQAPITQFTQAEIDAGVIQFAHNDSNLAPNYQLVVTDGSQSSGPSQVRATLLP